MSKFLTLILILILLSLFFTSCFKWAARAEDKLPKQTALDKTYTYQGKVIIIGAGASGLAAAKVLEQNNIDYLILEATNRYGGRLKKDTTFADFPIDIGAEWIHSAPIVLNVLKGKKGEHIDEELIPYKLENTASWDGEKYKVNPNWENKAMYSFLAESKFKNSTWYDYIDKNIAQTVKHKIKYDSPVTEINYSNELITVKTENDKTFEADKVLVTVSMGVLKSNLIKFIPKLSPEKKKAIEEVTFHQGFKVALKFTEKFYPDVVNCKVKSGEKGFYDIAFGKDTKANILGFLCTGDATSNYYLLNTNQKIVQALVEELDEMFEGKASATFTGDYILEDWGRHQYTQGTWTKAFEEKKSHLETLNQSIDNKIYFAGEIFDPYRQMGVPGAVLSGYYSIDRLLNE
jgi:monoamine oxidase